MKSIEEMMDQAPAQSPNETVSLKCMKAQEVKQGDTDDIEFDADPEVSMSLQSVACMWRRDDAARLEATWGGWRSVIEEARRLGAA